MQTILAQVVHLQDHPAPTNSPKKEGEAIKGYIFALATADERKLIVCLD